ncbi:MAG: hypothetical protein U1E28_03350 [Beijerinckiaceae bacterium]
MSTKIAARGSNLSQRARGISSRIVAVCLALSLGGAFASQAFAQQAGWSRNLRSGIESGPLPVPDPDSMSSGPPLYTQQLGNNMPDPGDIAPDNGQSFTIFNRRF